MKEISKTQKYREKVKILLEKHGWKLNVPPSLLDPNDRAKLGGGLRCFKMVHDRNPDGSKLPTMHRCGNPAAKGSFFCKKKHGGGNQRALTTGSASMIQSAYRGVMKADVGNIFDSFINDPTLMDLRPELASMRTLLAVYFKKVSHPEKNIKSVSKTLKFIRKTLKDEDIDDKEKYLQILLYCSKIQTLTDGEVLDRIGRMMVVISKLIDSIDKTQNKEEFMLTPDGMKVLFRGIIECLKKRLPEDLVGKVKQDLIGISTRTQAQLPETIENKAVVE